MIEAPARRFNAAQFHGSVCGTWSPHGATSAFTRVFNALWRNAGFWWHGRPGCRSRSIRATGRAHRSTNHQRGVLALALAQAARLHPVIGAVEQRRIVVVDM